MRVPDHPDPIRVRWYAVPNPGAGNYELTDFSSSDWDEDPKSSDPELGEQSTVRSPFEDWRSCSGPPFPPPPRQITGAGFNVQTVIPITRDARALNRLFDLVIDPYPAWVFTSNQGTVSATRSLPPPPLTVVSPALLKAKPTQKGITVTLSFPLTFTSPLQTAVITYKGVQSPVTVPLPVRSATHSSLAWDASTMRVPGYAPEFVEEDMLIGSLVWDTGTDAIPPKFLLADGSRVSQVTYALYFARVGFSYGADLGDGKFTLPDLRGRVAMGFSATHAMTSTGGEDSHTLSSAEMPSHTHTMNQTAHKHLYDTAADHVPGTSGGFLFADSAVGDAAVIGVDATTFVDLSDTKTQSITISNNNTGGGGSHNNLQPFIAQRPLIFVGV